MAYSKAKLKTNGDRASPCFRHKDNLDIIKKLNTQAVMEFIEIQRHNG
jgi:hypothetical protein